MSKKAKKKVMKKPVARRAARTVRAARMVKAAPPGGRATNSATIFVYDTGGGVRVRTSPQLLSCAPGYVEWTVVNLTSGPMPDVDITWQKDGPWGGVPIPIRGGSARLSLQGANEGRFKYNVSCGGYTEDPEVEYPQN